MRRPTLGTYYQKSEFRRRHGPASWCTRSPQNACSGIPLLVSQQQTIGSVYPSNIIHKIKTRQLYGCILKWYMPNGGSLLGKMISTGGFGGASKMVISGMMLFTYTVVVPLEVFHFEVDSAVMSTMWLAENMGKRWV